MERIQEGNVVEGAEMMMPSIVGSVAKAYRYGKEGTGRGLGDAAFRQAEDFNTAQLIMQALGFPPADLAAEKKYSFEAKRADSRIMQERGRLFTKFRNAVIRNNKKQLSDVVEDMENFNSKYPLPRYFITAKGLKKSIQSMKNKAKSSYLGVTINLNKPGLYELLSPFGKKPEPLMDEEE